MLGCWLEVVQGGDQQAVYQDLNHGDCVPAVHDLEVAPQVWRPGAAAGEQEDSDGVVVTGAQKLTG